MWWIKRELLRLKLYIGECFQNEAESLITWYAISFALGTAFYFVVPYEIPSWLLVLYFEAILFLLYIYKNKEAQFKFLTYVLLFMLGLCVAKSDALYRSKKIEHNLSEITYLNGKVKVLDYNRNNRQRITLTNVNNFERELKGDFKISLNQKLDWLKEGKCVELVAKLPKDLTPNPIGSYNNDRTNFYRGLSKVGYSIGPVYEKDCKTKQNKISLLIFKIRNSLKNKVLENTNKDAGAIINAITIGDKGNISENLYENYRVSGLAHFLSISGMHMSIIALLVFFIVRILLLPFTKGQYDLRKPAAVLSIIITFLYFLISGQSVSCIRAFIMTTLILLAILFNRRAISIRLWAFAVLVVVIITPVAVVSPGFLMSFSATLGLIAYYEKNTSKVNSWFNRKTIFGKFTVYFAGILVTDLIASLMTLPYSMYFFNQIAIYTTIGNILAGPIIAFWVMPAILLFLITSPFSISKYSLIILEKGIDIINQIASYVTNLPGANLGYSIGSSSDWGVFIITIGLLWLCIWQSKWRIWGIWFIIIGLICIITYPKPDFVFDKYGTTYAYRTNKNKLTMSPWHKNNFLERMWTKENTKGKIKLPNNEDIECTKERCIYKKQIEFGPKFVKFNGKEIPLKDGGYINLKKGIYYYNKERGRLWN